VGGRKGDDQALSLENLRLRLGPDDVNLNGTLQLGGAGHVSG